MDPEAQRVQRTQRVQEQTTVPGTTKFETQCHSISLGCDNRWFRLDINPVVTIASAVIIWALVMVCMIWPDEVCFKYINLFGFLTRKCLVNKTWITVPNYYRPQQYLRKSNVFASVCHFVSGGNA